MKYEDVLKSFKENANKLISKHEEGKFSIPLTSLGVSITKACNLECIYCHAAETGFVSSHIELEVFKKLLVNGNQLTTLNLTSGGESFVHPKIDDIIEISRELAPNAKIRIITNGIFPLSKRRLKALEKLNYIGISVDGATKKTFEEIRKPAKFETFLETVSAISKLKKEYSLDLVIRFVFTASQRNIHELPELVELANKLGGINDIYCNPMRVRSTGLTSLYKLEQLEYMNPEELNNILDESKSLAKQYGIGLNINNSIYSDIDLLDNDMI